MDMNEYQNLAWRTAGGKSHINFVLGLVGEAGEVAECIKKRDFHKRYDDFPPERVAEEIGDVLWYAACLAHMFGYDLSVIAHENINKLRNRYPKGFTEGGGER